MGHLKEVLQEWDDDEEGVCSRKDFRRAVQALGRAGKLRRLPSREELDAHAPEHAYCEVRDKDKAAADGDEKKQPLLSTRTCPSTHTARCATKTKRRMVMRRNHC